MMSIVQGKLIQTSNSEFQMANSDSRFDAAGSSGASLTVMQRVPGLPSVCLYGRSSSSVNQTSTSV
jgi:coproporphyrinogen III oxidase